MPMPNTVAAPRSSTSLRTVLLRWVAVCIALQLVMILMLARFQLFSQVEALQVELNTSLAAAVGESVSQAVQRPVTAVQESLRHWATLQQSPKFVQAALQQLADNSEAADIVYVLAPDGKVIHVAAASGDDQSNGIGRLGLDMSRSQVLRGSVVGRAVVSPMFLSPITDQPSIAVSGLHADGSMLVMELNLSRLAERYNRTNVGTGAQVMIVDASGQIIADKGGTKSRQSALLPASAMHLLQSAKSGTLEMDGEVWLTTNFPIGNNGLNWRVLVMRPLSEVYRPVVAIVVFSLAATFVILLATFFFLMAGVRRVVLQTEVLSSNARALQSGSEPSTGTLTVRELCDVDASLRDMASTLLQREQLLRQTNEALEERVADRTRHLEEANQVLEVTLKKLETTQVELVQSAKMSALGGMVAGIAHELNTPVGNARLTSTTLLHTAQSILKLLDSGQVSRGELLRSAQTVRDGAQLIDRSLERAGEIVQAFKQVAVDQASRRRRAFLLRDVLHENEVLLTPRLKQAGITVAIDVPERIEMQSFPGDLGQVVTNLIENAVVHGYPDVTGGKIDITAQFQGEGLVCIRVRDYGRGIPADALARVFDPFYTTRLGQGGSGLGLAIVYNIVVSSLGGKIAVTSQPGQGTCFTIDIPLVAPAHENEG